MNYTTLPLQGRTILLSISKKLISNLLLLFLAFQLSAQISIEGSEFTRALNQDVEFLFFFNQPDTEVPESGENMIWDYTNLDFSDGSSIFTFKTTAGTLPGYPEINSVINSTSPSTILSGVNTNTDFYRTLDETGFRTVGRKILSAPDFSLAFLSGNPADAISFPESFEIYDEPIIDSHFPMHFGDEFLNHTVNFKQDIVVTLSPFGIFNTPGQVLTKNIYNREINGWGTLKVIEPFTNTPVELEVLLLKDTQIREVNYTLGGQPIPAFILGLLGLENGAITIQTEYQFWTKHLDGPAFYVQHTFSGIYNVLLNQKIKDIPCLIDDTPPTLICHDVLLPLNENGNAIASLNALTNGSSDDCTNIDFSMSNTNFDCTNIGINFVNISANDEKGNLSNCTAKVTIIDNQSPVIGNCPNDMIVASSTNDCSYEFVWDDLNISDNCGTPDIYSNIQSGTSFEPGIYFPEVQAVDDVGNSSICSFQITVEDNLSPTIDCPTDMELISLASEPISVEFSAPISDACDFNVLFMSHQSGDLFDLGITTVNIAAADPSGNEVNCSFEVSVVTSGKIFCPENIEVSLADSDESEVFITWNQALGLTACEASMNLPLNDFDYLGMHDGHRYYVSKVGNETWQMAQFLAEETGGYLAVINNERENEFLSQMMDDLTSAWIGLSNLENTDSYSWTGENSGDYSNWFGGNPLETAETNGVVLLESGLWLPLFFNSTEHFIVEIPDFSVASSITNHLFEIGTTTVEYTFTDQCEAINTCEFDIIVQEETAEYCSSKGQILNNNHWIETANFNNNDFNSGNNQGYQNLTNEAIEMNSEASFFFSLEPNAAALNKNCFWRIWMDWNSDGDFYDENELIFETRQKGIVESFLNFSDINTNISGRLRVGMSLVNFPEPCGDLQAGEVEDFQLDIQTSNVSHLVFNSNNGVNTSSTFSVYPNPTNQNFTIDLGNTETQNTEISIFNNLGQQVWQKIQREGGSPKIEVSLAGFANGIYLIQMLQNEDRKIKKLVLNNLNN